MLTKQTFERCFCINYKFKFLKFLPERFHSCLPQSSADSGRASTRGLLRGRGGGHCAAEVPRGRGGGGCAHWLMTAVFLSPLNALIDGLSDTTCLANTS